MCGPGPVSEERTLWCPFCGMAACRGECTLKAVERLAGDVMSARPKFGESQNTFAEVPVHGKARPEYESLARVFDDALEQAQGGKGIERHAGKGERFEDQQIVQLGEWMGSSTVFAIGQACKKSIESTRLPDDRARAELLGAINYLAAAVIVIDRRSGGRE